MHHRLTTRTHHRGLALTDLLVAGVVLALLTSLLLPSLARARNGSMVDASLDNLRTLGIAHVVYALDYNGRQFSYLPDDFAAYGDTVGSATSGWEDTFGELPGVTLGWGLIEGGPLVNFQYDPSFNTANASLMLPIQFDTPVQYFGAFRFPNAKQFNQYVGNRVYDERFYAATDGVVWPLAEPLFDDPYEFVDTPPTPGIGDIPVWSSYILSPAAMFDPSTMQARQMDKGGGIVGGWIDPFSVDDGFASPGFFNAKYANLKTLMIEHHWLQNAPIDPCNPAIDQGSYGDCEPYSFNHGIDSAPGTLFFDLSTRLLPNTEAVAADDQLRAASGGLDGTWLRTTPFGEDGYFSEIAFDMTRVSHHVLTADGILGRDTVEGAGGSMDGDRYADLRQRRRATGTTAPPPAKRSGPLLSNGGAD